MKWYWDKAKIYLKYENKYAWYRALVSDNKKYAIVAGVRPNETVMRMGLFDNGTGKIIYYAPTEQDAKYHAETLEEMLERRSEDD